MVDLQKKTVVAVIQARMGSSRLPNKTLVNLAGKPLLGHVIERLQWCKRIDDIIVATTINSQDNAIFEYCRNFYIKTFRGNETNVLDRYYCTAFENDLSIIVRITADDPIKEPIVIDRAIEELLKESFDYVSNTLNPTFPEGLDVEVFTFEALEKAWQEAKLQSELEHVTPYIWKNPKKFKVKNIENDIDLSGHRWTIDTAEDLNFIRKIYERLYIPGQIFLMENVLELLRLCPEITHLMPNIERNFGYKYMLKNEAASRQYSRPDIDL